MDYTVKLQTVGVTGPLSTCMSHRNHGEVNDSATESKFYLPVGVSPSSEPSLLERVRATLFSHRI